jgi:peptidoglycan/xylan/chitin deacetylase (PgdA/CDA1 family)
MFRTAACVVFGMALLLAGPVRGEECTAASGSLAVGRTIEIDTGGGPWFGAPRDDGSFLRPGEVVLTFDDGPAPRSTAEILKTLDANCVKATFFMVGEMAARHPQIVREVAARGHTIGAHTWSHANLKRQSFDGLKFQIEYAFSSIEHTAGHPIAPFFRFPYLSSTPRASSYLQSRNIGQFAVDIDSFDWRLRNPKRIVARVMSELSKRGKGIILLHDIHAATAAALPDLLAQLNKGGYTVVHLRPKAPAESLVAYSFPRAAPHAARPRQVAMRTHARLAWRSFR